MLAATLASVVAVVLAQVAGELARWSVLLLGDAQLGPALAASAFACVVVALVEGPRR